MSSDLLTEARKYLITFLEGKHNDYESRHPWRKGWEFVVLHSFQVEAYVQRILEHEQHALNTDEILRLRLAAILHDIGRLEQTDNHAKTGVELVDKWLQTQPGIKARIDSVEKLLELIGSHSEKDTSEPDFSKAVLKDADILDEIGILSVFMAANWIDPQSPFFFHQLRHRLEEFEIPFCERQFARLNTLGGRALLNEKKEFIRVLINQLDQELDCDAEARRLLSELFRKRSGG